MTAGYIFRLYLRCFHGAPRGTRHDTHAHESPMSMVLPMMILGVGAVLAGLSGSPWFHHPFFHLLGVREAHEGLDLPILFWSTAAAAGGIALAWMVGVTHRLRWPKAFAPLGQACYRLAANKYYVDELYDRALIRPFLAATEALARVDRQVIDGAVDGAGRFGWGLGVLKERFDRLVVDRLVNGTAQAIRGAGSALRWLQTGIVQHYLFVVVVAVVVLSVVVRR